MASITERLANIRADTFAAREAVKAWDQASDGDSDDAEHDAAYELRNHVDGSVDDIRFLIREIAKRDRALEAALYVCEEELELRGREDKSYGDLAMRPLIRKIQRAMGRA